MDKINKVKSKSKFDSKSNPRTNETQGKSCLVRDNPKKLLEGHDVSKNKSKNDQSNMSDEAVIERMNEHFDGDQKHVIVRAKLIIAGFTKNEIMNCLGGNEDGDAALLTGVNKNEFIYDKSAKEWYYWNDTHWRIDKKENIYQDGFIKLKSAYAFEIDRQIDSIEKTDSPATIKKHQDNVTALEKRIFDISTDRRKNAILRGVIKGTKALNLAGDEWDKNNYLIAFKNVVYDLSKDKAVEANPEDYIRTRVPHKYDKNAKAPEFEKYLKEMLGNKQPVYECLLRVLGCILAGDVIENIVPYLWGKLGRNGKSKFINILKYVFGGLVGHIPAEFMMDSKFKKQAESPDAILLTLEGKRFVFASETSKNDILNTSKLKGLSGGDMIIGRGPYNRYVSEFMPTHTIITVTNRLPMVDSEDEAMWKRLLVFETPFSYVDNPKGEFERLADKNLYNKIIKEASGIINVIIDGYRDYIIQGINPPDEVKLATETYRKDQDVTGRFIEETCSIVYPDAFTSSKDLRDSYKQWCEDNGHHAKSTNKFSTSIAERPGIERKKVKNVRGFTGIFIIEE